MREPDRCERLTVSNEDILSQRITVGMPLYQGKDQVADALRSLQAQTFEDFEVIISVDGADSDSADACRPFLADQRFRMVVHQQRLDWFGNFNWLLQQPMGDFFCYRQHDDTTAPDFFEKLVSAADARPDAAAVYADCQWCDQPVRQVGRHIQLVHQKRHIVEPRCQPCRNRYIPSTGKRRIWPELPYNAYCLHQAHWHTCYTGDRLPGDVAA